VADGDAFLRRLLEALHAEPIRAVKAMLGVVHAGVVAVEAAAIEVGVTGARVRILLHLARGFLKREPIRVAQLLARELGDGDARLREPTVLAVGSGHRFDEIGFVARDGNELVRIDAGTRSVIGGGGGVLREDNRRLLRASGRVVYLTADVETLWRRLQGDSATAERRPALTVGGREEIEEVLRVREPLYRSCADLIVEKVVILEIKSIETILPVHEAQILTYLRLSGCHIGLLLNFNTKLLKNGLRRFIS